MGRRLSFIAFALILPGALAGCGGRAPMPGPGLMGELRPAGPALRSADLYPMRDRRFVELDPETREPVRIEILRNSNPDSVGTWTRTSAFESLDGQVFEGGGGERAKATTLVRLADGSVALVSLVARAPSATNSDDALYLFEPALVMTPELLNAGAVWEGVCDLRVVALDDHTKVIKTGSAARRIEHLGVQTLQSRRGPIETIRLRTELSLKMGAIRSVTQSDIWVSPGEGVLGESSARVSSLMGIPVQRARELRWGEHLLESADDQPSER